MMGHLVYRSEENRRGSIIEAVVDAQLDYYSIYWREDFVEFETGYEEEEDNGGEVNDGNANIPLGDNLVSIVVASAQDGDRMLQFSKRNCFTAVGATPTLSEEGVQFISDLFSLLHGIILREEKAHGSDAAASRKLSLDVHPDQLFEFASKDNRLLMRCIFSLATGKCLPQVFNDRRDVYDNSFRYGIFVACDMIRRIVLNKPCITQQVLGDQLSVYNLSQKVRKLLTTLRITESVDVTKRISGQHLEAKLHKGIKIGLWDLIILLTDNIGFRRLGAKAGYSQHIIMQLVIIPYANLKRLGFYSDDGSAFSRERKLWEDERKEISAKEMSDVAPELVLYSQRKLSLIEEAIRLANMLPTLDQAEEMVESSQWVWDERVPGQIDVQREVRAAADTTETVTPIGDSIDNLPEGGTMLDVNHGFSDIPHDIDLNTEKAVKELLSCVVRLRNKALKEKNQEVDEIVEAPISEDIGGFLLCDGAPAEMSARIQDEDSNSEGEKKYEHARCFAMGFHFLLHAHRGTDLLFGETHLNHAVGQWRKSFKQIQWYLFPGDPNQTDREKPEYIFAHYVAATRKCAEAKGTNELSAVEVWDHMMSRAKEHPLLFIILMELNFADISFMIRDSEKMARLVILIYFCQR